MPIELVSVPYSVDGQQFDGFIADGSEGRQVPGILVAHEGRGFTQHAKDRAQMLAELGYVAYAPDYFGDAASSLEHAYRLMQPFKDRDRYRSHGNAALDVLRKHAGVDSSQLGAIGFCWGGYAVLELACHADLRSVVGFHPGLSPGPLSEPREITASVLVCVGNQDPYVPMSDISAFLDQMDEGEVDCQVLILRGAPHSFTNPEPYAYETGTPNVGYDLIADRRSWTAMRNHFREAFPRI